MNPLTPSHVVDVLIFVIAVAVAMWCVFHGDLANDLVNGIRRYMLGSRLRVYGPKRSPRLRPTARRLGIAFLLSGITGYLIMARFGFQSALGLVGFLLVAIACSGLLFPFQSWLPKRRN